MTDPAQPYRASGDESVRACERVRAVAEAADGPVAVVLAHLAGGLVDDLAAAADPLAAGEREPGGATPGPADGSPELRAVAADLVADPRERDRLALATRRLLGEALAAAAVVVAAPPPPAALKALKSGHRRRTAALGL